jgi:hypothetical protein
MLDIQFRIIGSKQSITKDSNSDNGEPNWLVIVLLMWRLSASKPNYYPVARGELSNTLAIRINHGRKSVALKRGVPWMMRTI